MTCGERALGTLRGGPGGGSLVRILDFRLYVYPPSYRAGVYYIKIDNTSSKLWWVGLILVMILIICVCGLPSKK